MTVSEMNTKELNSLAKDLDFMIFKIQCYSSNDFRLLLQVLNELNERNNYVQKHINEEHDFSYANDKRDYDICLYCDCRRYNNSDEWVVE